MSSSAYKAGICVYVKSDHLNEYNQQSTIYLII